MQILLLAALAVFGTKTSAGLCAEQPSPTTQPAQADEALVNRFYDVRAWTTPMYDFSLDSSAHSAAFVTPANIQTATFDYRQTGQRYPSGKERTTPSPEERVAALMKLIEENVSPESWRDGGGQATIGELRGTLVVRQTPANQDAVAKLLRGLKDHLGQTVRTTADWFILPPADADKFLHRGVGDKKAAAIDSADLKALVKLAPGVPHFHAEILCLDGQTVSYISGRERSLLANQSVSAKAGETRITPFMANAGAGIALQICPVLDEDAKRAAITFLSTYNDPEKPGAPIPVETVSIAEQPGKSPSRAVASGNVRPENGIIHEFRSTVRLPLGTPTIAGTMTLEPTAKTPEGREMVLILSVHG